jgi:hypothetical protein
MAAFAIVIVQTFPTDAMIVSSVIGLSLRVQSRIIKGLVAGAVKG